MTNQQNQLKENYLLVASWELSLTEAISALTKSKVEGFTSDDVWAWLRDNRPKTPTKYISKAIGAAIRSAYKAGYITRVGYKQSARKGSSPVGIYKDATRAK